MTIQIRLDVPALERLIGGDSAVEIELRKGVVEEFARRHLTAVLKDDTFKAFLAEEAKVTSVGLNAIVHDKIGKIEHIRDVWKGDRNIVTLRDGVRDEIVRKADEVISDAIAKAVDERWKLREPGIVNEISRAIREKTDSLTSVMVKTLVTERLAKIASEIKA